MIYAILDSENRCVNLVVWDGQTEWQPPEGCTAVPDPDRTYTIYEEPTVEVQVEEIEEDPLASLTLEQKQALVALIQT